MIETLSKQTGRNMRVPNCAATEVCPRCNNEISFKISGICKDRGIPKSRKLLVCGCCGYRVDLPLN
jgi:hypothetical protein